MITAMLPSAAALASGGGSAGNSATGLLVFQIVMAAALFGSFIFFWGKSRKERSAYAERRDTYAKAHGWEDLSLVEARSAMLDMLWVPRGGDGERIEWAARTPAALDASDGPLVCDYLYSSGAGQHRHTSRHIAAIAETGLDLPDVMIRRRSRDMKRKPKRKMRLRHSDIGVDTGSSPFNATYILDADDKDAARRLLASPLQSQLLELKPDYVRLSGSRLCVAEEADFTEGGLHEHHGKPQPARLADLATTLAGALPSSPPTERGTETDSDDGTGAPG